MKARGTVAVPAVLALNLAATLVTGLVTLRDFPNSADEYSYCLSAEIFSEGRLSVPSPRPRESFDFTHVLNDGRFYGKYPPGWPLLLSAGTLLGTPWIVNPVLGTLTLLTVYLTARRHFSPAIANIALFSTLCNPYFVFNSASYFSHSSCLFFTALAVHFYFEYLSDSAPRTGALLFGLSAGAAFLIRPYTAAALLAPLAAHLFVDAASRKRWGTLAKCLPFMAIPAVLFVALFLAYNAAQTGNPFLQPFQKYDPSDTPSLGGMIGELGPRLRDHLALRLLDLSLWLPLAPFFVLAFLASREARANSKGVLLVTMFLALLASYVPYWGSGIFQYGPRYLYEASGALVIVSACVASRYARGGALILAGMLLVNASTFVTATRHHGRDVRERMELYDAVKRQGISGAVVFLKTGSGTMPPGDLTRNGIRFDGPVLYAHDRGALNDRVLEEHPGRKGYSFEYDRAAKRGKLVPLPGR